MTFRNGTKEYLSMLFIYGSIMGLLYGLMDQSLVKGIVLGLINGSLFTGATYVSCRYQEKKFDDKREEIVRQRNIICDGRATWQGNGGWLFFTDFGLEFYPHKINVSRNKLTIPANTIKSVIAKKNQIVVDTADNSTFVIVVSHNKEWKKQIEARLTFEA